MSQGLTQREVAGLLDMNSAGQVSRWERGERLPNLKQALRLSAIYGRLVNDIFADCFNAEREWIRQKEQLLQDRKQKMNKNS